jgi:FkbM family methyltransferase
MRRLASESSRGGEVNLVSQVELKGFDRARLERRSRGLARAAYLGDSASLCRVLGRYKMYVDTTDVGFGAHLLLDGFWESWLTVFAARRLEPGMRVADVGANHGYYTLLMADLVGAVGRVAAVEPNPRMADLLRKSVAINGFADRVETFAQAASDRDDHAIWMRLPVNEPKNAHRVSGPDAPALAGDETIEVPAARLATMLSQWDRLEFAKIDVEGAEEATIMGLMPILERDKPDVVLEFNARRCAEPRQLIDSLESVYDRIRCVGVDAEAHDVVRETLFDCRRDEDWLLFLSVRD